ncbi:glutamate--tRNA ligase [Gammaproteobacteria bacterium]|nr:glutamate--tRNA ligase [Gammaproteobacteria bacterium]
MPENKLRFAPSPTGDLHIGNARTLILNYVYSKSISGELILRIDDTDKDRSEERFYSSIIKDVEWLKISISAIEKQSSKTEKYKKIRDYLIKEGYLYPCYETDEELNRLRKVSLSGGLPPIYDRASLKLTKQEIKDHEANGIKPYWRFKLDRENITWNDLIRGEQTIACNSFSDPVLIRADGTFLYTLPSVVDDIDMGITHVLRGEDHVSNTATQIQLFKILGSNVPNFGHHSLMVQKDGSRMSKRIGSMSLKDIRDSGIEPMTLLNYCARIGTSDAIEAFQSIDQLVNNYSLTKISRSPARFSFEELMGLNKKVLQNISFRTLAKRLIDLDIEGKDAEIFWDTVKTNINTINEAQKWWNIVKDDKINIDLRQINRDFLKIAQETLPITPWNDKTWSIWTDEISQKTGLKGRELFLPLRIALTGENSGPELAKFILLLGRDLVLSRLNI